jgi:hypothetical protein
MRPQALKNPFAIVFCTGKTITGTTTFPPATAIFILASLARLCHLR